MTDSYNQQTANHYSSFRPPLHPIILKKILPVDKVFSTGLDIGCGTGYSTIALAGYCSNVIGIDPSQAMLDRTTEHPKITYVKGSGEDIPLPDNSVDVVTFAGSLFYMDLSVVASELKRVCGKEAVILVYDFEILPDDILAVFDITDLKNNSEYDHTINFSGIKNFSKINAGKEQIDLKLTPTELTHVLLSNHSRYKVFTEKYSSDHLFEKLKNEIRASGNSKTVQTNIFYSTYQIIYE